MTEKKIVHPLLVFFKNKFINTYLPWWTEIQIKIIAEETEWSNSSSVSRVDEFRSFADNIRAPGTWNKC